MNHPRRVSSIVMMGALLTGLAALPAAADETNRDPIDELLADNPGLTREIVIESADAAAIESGKSRDAVIEDFLLAEQDNRNIEQQILRSQEEKLTLDMQTRASDPGSITLPKSYYRGDIYYTPVTYYGAHVHGHVGIYGDTNWVVEAPGDGRLSDWWWNHQITVRPGAVLMETTLTQWQQDAAADYAYYHLRHYPYNRNFLYNKQLNPSSLNCSQLVWLAYKKGAGVDLDTNGGPGVYPGDIYTSDYTVVNWNIR